MDAVQAGAAAGRAAAPLRLLGLAAVGNVPALLLFLALAAACMALCGKALAKPYLRLLTLEPGRAKVEYRAKIVRVLCNMQVWRNTKHVC